MAKIASTDKVIHDPRPVLESDVQDAINDHAQMLAASGDKPRKIRLDFVLGHYIDEATLEAVVSDAINEFIVDAVDSAYSEALAELEAYFE